MDDTRVNRYKEYRQSFIKEGSISVEDDSSTTIVDISSTTSTLPMGQVISAVQEEEDKKNREQIVKRNRTIGIIIKIAVAVLLVAGLIVLGIFAWGR